MFSRAADVQKMLRLGFNLRLGISCSCPRCDLRLVDFYIRDMLVMTLCSCLGPGVVGYNLRFVGADVQLTSDLLDST